MGAFRAAARINSGRAAARIQRHAVRIRTGGVDGFERGRIAIAGHGLFYLYGAKLNENSLRTRLLMPVDEVRTAALEGQIWSYGKLIGDRREIPDAERELAKLAAVSVQSKALPSTRPASSLLRR